MPLDLAGVHIMRKGAGDNMVIVGKNPYMRFISEGNFPVSVQGGRFYADAGDRIELKDVPDWVKTAINRLTPEARKKIGLNPAGVDWEEAKPEPTEELASEEFVQILNKTEEVLSIVDAVYTLDPKNDSHWLKDGKPNLNEIAKLRGLRTVSRAEVEELTEGYRRPGTENSDGDSGN